MGVHALIWLELEAVSVRHVLLQESTHRGELLNQRSPDATGLGIFGVVQGKEHGKGRCKNIEDRYDLLHSCMNDYSLEAFTDCRVCVQRRGERLGTLDLLWEP